MRFPKYIYILLCIHAVYGIEPPANPSWWASKGVTISTSFIGDNSSPATLGQLKNFAFAGATQLENTLKGGAGSAIWNLVNSWPQRGTATQSQIEQNYSLLTIGQLKSVAKLFYDRLNEEWYDTTGNLIRRGYPDNWEFNIPWNPSTPVAQNYCPATIGQLKMAFSFDPEDERNIPVTYVSATAGGYLGTKQSPFLTIQAAANAATPGTKIKIAKGLYRESVSLSHGGTAGAPIVFEAAGAVTICGSQRETVWQFNQNANTGGKIYSIQSNYTTQIASIEGPYTVTKAGNPDVNVLPFSLRYSDLISVSPIANNDPAGRILSPVDSLYPISGSDHPALTNTEWSFFIDRSVSPPQIYINLPSGKNPSDFDIEVADKNCLFGPSGDDDGAGRVHNVQYISLKGIRFLHAQNSSQISAVRLRDNWTIENCTIEGTNGCGLGAVGNNIVIKGCKITRNGQSSLESSGEPGYGTNLTLENCEFSFNGWRGYNPSFDASFKIFRRNNSIVSNCKSFWNFGPGIWFDWKNRNVTISGCEIFGNSGILERVHDGSGIMIEASYGPISIHDNFIYSNAGPGIFICESGAANLSTSTHQPSSTDNPGVRIYSNVIADNYSAFALRGDMRPDFEDSSQPTVTLWGVVFGFKDGEQSQYGSNLIYKQRAAIIETMSIPFISGQRWDLSWDITVNHNIYVSTSSSNFLEELPVNGPLLNSAYTAINNGYGWEAASTSSSSPFSKQAIPSYTFPDLDYVNVWSGNVTPLASDGPPVDQRVLYTSLPTASSLQLTLPVFSRGPIVKNDSSSGYCYIYDVHENSRILLLNTSAALKLAGYLSSTPLTKPVFLRVITTSNPQSVELVPTPLNP